MFKVRKSEIGIGQIRVGKVGTREIHVIKVRAIKDSARKAHILKDHPSDGRIIEVDRVKVSLGIPTPDDGYGCLHVRPRLMRLSPPLLARRQRPLLAGVFPNKGSKNFHHDRMISG